MIFGDVTIQDCQREALLEVQITLFQRKINRLCKQISFKEEIAQGLLTPWFCAHYDNEVEPRYLEMAQLEGAVRAAQLELDRLADKRYADKARRLAALALIEEVGKKATAATTPASAPPSDPRQKQQAMFFGPGTPPAAPSKSASPSVTIDQKAEDDIARAFEICRREIPPPDPTPATATPSPPPPTPPSSEKPAVTPLTHSTLSRLAMPAAVAESDSVGRKEDSAADSFARADDSQQKEAESGKRTRALTDTTASDDAPTSADTPASADTQGSTEMPASAVAPDSRIASQDRAAESPSGTAGDAAERAVRDESSGMQ